MTRIWTAVLYKYVFRRSDHLYSWSCLLVWLLQLFVRLFYLDFSRSIWLIKSLLLMGRCPVQLPFVFFSCFLPLEHIRRTVKHEFPLVPIRERLRTRLMPRAGTRRKANHLLGTKRIRSQPVRAVDEWTMGSIACGAVFRPRRLRSCSTLVRPSPDCKDS
jgi:hypothetical protein